MQTPEQRRTWEARNPDYRRQYREKNLEKVRERCKEGARRYRQRNPDKAKEYYRKNTTLIAEKTRADKLANPDKYRIKSQRYWASVKGRANYMLRAAKNRHETVTITREWIQERLDRGVCEVTGLPFVIESRLVKSAIREPWSPSLDKKDPLQGYTPENTQVVVWAYNTAKGSWKHEDVLTMARALLR